MSVPHNADGSLKALELNLSAMNKWSRKESKKFLRMLQGETTAEKLDRQDQFLAEHSNWTFDEIQELDNDEITAIFNQIGDRIQENAVPKASAASS